MILALIQKGMGRSRLEDTTQDRGLSCYKFELLMLTVELSVHRKKIICECCYQASVCFRSIFHTLHRANLFMAHVFKVTEGLYMMIL